MSYRASIRENERISSKELLVIVVGLIVASFVAFLIGIYIKLPPECMCCSCKVSPSYCILYPLIPAITFLSVYAIILAVANKIIKNKRR